MDNVLDPEPQFPQGDNVTDEQIVSHNRDWNLWVERKRSRGETLSRHECFVMSEEFIRCILSWHRQLELERN